MTRSTEGAEKGVPGDWETSPEVGWLHPIMSVLTIANGGSWVWLHEIHCSK